MLTLINAEPGLYFCDSDCVLGVIEDHFHSRQAFTDALPSEFTAIGYEVATECSTSAVHAPRRLTVYGLPGRCETETCYPANVSTLHYSSRGCDAGQKLSR